MGRKLFLAVLVAGLLAWGGSAQAAIMDPVYFYAVDNRYDNDTYVYLDIKDYTNRNWTLQYSYDNAQWNSAPNILVVDTGSQGGFKKIYFRIIENNNNKTITNGDLTFNGIISGSLYHTAIIFWELGQEKYDVSINTAQGQDAVSPAPLPGSVLLLGSGLLGLALLYRRRRKTD
jgi:hypothetical protein